MEMDYPDRDQILLVELPKDTDMTEVETASVATVEKESLWSKLVSLLD